MIHVNRYERIWMTFGIGILVLFLAIITATALLEGLVPPSYGATIDPTKVSSTPPFDKPGLRQVGPGQYEAYYIAHIFSFNPAKITVPVGSRVTFFVTTPDVTHGFSIPLTGVNLEIVPGYVASVAQTFHRAGTFLIVCNEYCGSGHQLMSGQVVVTP